MYTEERSPALDAARLPAASAGLYYWWVACFSAYGTVVQRVKNQSNGIKRHIGLHHTLTMPVGEDGIHNDLTWKLWYSRAENHRRRITGISVSVRWTTKGMHPPVKSGVWLAPHNQFAPTRHRLGGSHKSATITSAPCARYECH